MATPAIPDGEGIYLDTRTRTVSVRGRRADVTAQEYRVLALLYDKDGAVVTKEELARHIWPNEDWRDRRYPERVDAEAAARIEQIVYQLRRKLEPDPQHPRHLLTQRGIGYWLVARPDAPAFPPWTRPAEGEPLAAPPAAPPPPALPPTSHLAPLWRLARATSHVWPLPAERVPRVLARAGTRGLGAPQEEVQHGYRLGGKLCLAIQLERPMYLLLLDEGPEGIVYCLCPSWFAPDPRLRPGLSFLPQDGSRYDAFVATGEPGRERLLAILSTAPLGFDWMPDDPKLPARVLTRADIEQLQAQLQALPAEQWTALATYFDVLA